MCCRLIWFGHKPQLTFLLYGATVPKYKEGKQQPPHAYDSSTKSELILFSLVTRRVKTVALLSLRISYLCCIIHKLKLRKKNVETMNKRNPTNFHSAKILCNSSLFCCSCSVFLLIIITHLDFKT